MSTARLVKALRQDIGELQDRQGGDWTREQSADYLARGPVAFGTERLGSSYWHRQVDILEAAWKKPQVAVRSANSMGKNFTAADLWVWWVYARGGTVLYMSNTDRQLAIGMKELRRALRDSGLPFDLYHRCLRVNGEDRVIAMTSTSADSLRGYHDPDGLLVCIDEGQGQSVEAVAYDAAFSCATGEGDRILVLGNPAHGGSRFEAITKNPDWTALKIPASEHPNIVEGRVVIRGGPAPDWPERVAREYGKESAFYLAFVEAEFPPEGSIDSLLRREWLEAAHERYEAAPGWKPEPRPVAALDVARSVNRDESVCAIAQGPRLHSFHSWRSRDLVDTAGRFLHVTDRARLEWHLARTRKTVDPTAPILDDPAALLSWLQSSGAVPWELHIDAPGVGSGAVDDCRRRGRKVTEFWPWNPARDAKKMANLRAETAWTVRGLLESGQAAFPRDAKFVEEAMAMEYGLDSKGRVIMLDKDTLRKALGRSPDRWDSAAIALTAATGGLRGPTVSFTSISI